MGKEQIKKYLNWANGQMSWTAEGSGNDIIASDKKAFYEHLVKANVQGKHVELSAMCAWEFDDDYKVKALRTVYDRISTFSEKNDYLLIMLLYVRNINQIISSIVLLLLSLLTLQMTIAIGAAYAQNYNLNQSVEWHLSQIGKLEKVLVQEEYLLERTNEEIVHCNKVIQEVIFANECLSGNKMIGFPFAFKYSGVKVQNIRELQVFASLLKDRQFNLEQFHVYRKTQMSIINDIRSKIEYHSKQLEQFKEITSPKDLEGMWLIVGNGSIVSIYKDQNFGTMVGVLAEINDIKCHRVRDIIWTNIKISDQNVFVGTENSYDLQCRPRSYPFSLIPSGSFLQYSSKYSTMTLKRIDY